MCSFVSKARGVMAAGLVLLLMIVTFEARGAHAADGIGPALEQPGSPAERSATPELQVDEVRPHWCNATAALVDDIHRIGGVSIMRIELAAGRVLERYAKGGEEVIIEHGADGNSCLVDILRR